MTKIRIHKIDTSHVKSIIDIANKQFGNGFLTELEVINHIKTSNKYGFVSSNNTKVSGFILGSVCESFTDLESIIVSNYKWFETNLIDKFPIAVLETISVDSDLKGHGIGKLLTTYFLNEINELSKTTLTLVWEHQGGTPLAYILEKCGFQQKIRIANYWGKDSLYNNYDCFYCGHPPCKCSVMVYMD